MGSRWPREVDECAVSGHRLVISYEIPLGWCGCGCGVRTKICGQTNASCGHVKGEPLRFVGGHNPTTRAYFIPDENGCWIWQGARNEHGYGRLRVDGQRVYAHRYEYERAYGPIPDDRVLDHLCRVPACCNPDHLEVVTQTENVRRGLSTRLSPAIVRLIRSAKGKQSAKSLAAHYGVTTRTIWTVQACESWVDV